MIENEDELKYIMNVESTVNCNEIEADINIEKTFNDERIAIKNKNAIRLREKVIKSLENQFRRILNLSINNFLPAFTGLTTYSFDS